MRLLLIRTLLLPASALLLTPLLTGCGDARPASAGSSAIDQARLQPTLGPRIPDPTVPCPADATRLCNSDAETAGVIASYDDALAAANRTICWAREALGFSPCPLDDP